MVRSFKEISFDMIQQWLNYIIVVALAVWALVIDINVFKRGVYHASLSECRLPVLGVWIGIILLIFVGKLMRGRKHLPVAIWICTWLMAYFLSWVSISPVWLGLSVVFLAGSFICDDR